MPKITPNLWFDTQGEEAAEFYVSVFPNSKITAVNHYGEAGPREAGTVLTVDFVLDGQEYTAINGGPQFTFDEAISLLVHCAKDRFGLSWQIVPAGMEDILGDPDPARGQRAMKAMFGMKKLDVAALRAAADGA